MQGQYAVYRNLPNGMQEPIEAAVLPLDSFAAPEILGLWGSLMESTLLLDSMVPGTLSPESVAEAQESLEMIEALRTRAFNIMALRIMESMQ